MITAAGLLWTMSACHMASPSTEYPPYFQELIDTVSYRNIFYISCVLKYFGYRVKENIATISFSCVFFLSMNEWVFFGCVYKHCAHACICRGQRAQDPSELELWTAISPSPSPRYFCKSRERSFTTITSQPLLGYSELHVWLVGFSCNRSAPEAAALSMQVSSSLHIVFMLQ